MSINVNATDSEVVLLTKAIIVRNIKGYLFCPKMSMADKESVIELVHKAAQNLNLTFLRADEISKEVMEDLYNKHIISVDFIKNPSGKAVMFNVEDGISVVINEKEHITIQVISEGSQIAMDYAKADAIASVLENNLEIAYSEKYGFLTSDTQKVGTGLIIFSCVSIPGIDKTPDALSILNNRMLKYEWKLSQLGTLGKEKIPGIYVMRNITTLGATEKEIVSRAAKVIEDIVKLEKKCRETICNRKKGIVEDQFYKSYGIMRFARRMDEKELFEYISWLRMGLDTFGNSETGLTWEKINKITNKIIRNSKNLYTNQSASIKVNEEYASMVRSILKGED